MPKDPNDTRKFVGVWQNVAASGLKYMYGAEEQLDAAGNRLKKDDINQDTLVKWLIYKDKKNDKLRNLCRTIGKNKMENICDLVEKEGKANEDGEIPIFHSNGDYLLTENQFYEEGTQQPTYTLIIGRRPEKSSAGS